MLDTLVGMPWGHWLPCKFHSWGSCLSDRPSIWLLLVCNITFNSLGYLLTGNQVYLASYKLLHLSNLFVPRSPPSISKLSSRSSSPSFSSSQLLPSLGSPTLELLPHGPDVSTPSGTLVTPRSTFLSLPPSLSINLLHGQLSSSTWRC